MLADAGSTADAETDARDALSVVAQTDLLDLHGDVLLDLGDVLWSDGRDDEARTCVEQAVGFYERKGNIVSAESARGLLGARISRA